MKTYFLCLANSQKYGERCIAGIALRAGKRGERFGILKDPESQNPLWLRPVTRENFGQVPERFVQQVKLLDVLSFDVIAEAASGYQSENVLFNPYSLERIKSNTPKPESLAKLLPEKAPEFLLGNPEASLRPEEASTLNHSLQFIRAENPEIIAREHRYRTYWRMTFDYQGIGYDLPITDVHFLQRFMDAQEEFRQAKEIFLCISLGLPHQGLHYKLVAGVLCCT
jgi:hypothetical protein